jgi:hypothetical protein
MKESMYEFLGDDTKKKRGLHCRNTSLGEEKDNMMYLCKHNVKS